MTRTGLSCAVLVLASAAAFAQVPAGPEFLVSAPPDSTYLPDVAADAAGNFVIAWSDVAAATGNTIQARRFDPAGVAFGPPFILSTTVPATRARRPAIAPGPRGASIAVWENLDALDGSGIGVFGRRFDASGNVLGAAFQVNTYVTSDQSYPDIAADAAGNYVVVWSSTGQAGVPTERDIYAQLFDAGGARRGIEFRVNTYTTYNQHRPSVAAAAAGSFVVVWEGLGQDGGYGVIGQRYAVDGTKLGAEFVVNTSNPGDDRYPVIAADPAGNFVVAWLTTRPGQPVPTVRAARFTAGGSRIGAEFTAPTFTTDEKTSPAVAVAPSGDFVITWMSSFQDGDFAGIFGQRYDAAGAPRGAEMLINTWTTLYQRQPAVALDGAGNFVVAWVSYGQAASTSIFAQRFGGLVTAPTVVDPGGNGVLEPGETVGVATAWRNVNGTTQTFTGVASAFTGPGGPGNPTYTIVDGAASYGTVPDGAVGNCSTTGNCYTFSIGPVTASPTVRPVLHWDATFREDIFPAAQGQSPTRALHVGDSFADVPRSSPFYRFVETILHHDLTGGCGGGNFCPVAATPREQMAVLVLVAKERAGYVPAACVAGAELFADVPASSPFCRWIEELARRNIAGGCGGGNFCPLGPVSRQQMAVLALGAKEAPGYSPIPCVAGGERFADVPASSPFCKWVEELARRNIAGGCGGGNFCPIAEVTREQNAVFVSGTFALALY
jgi:hypothetical protein